MSHANEKENLTTRFSETNKTDFKGLSIYLFIHVTNDNDTYVSSAIKNPKFVFLTCVLPLLTAKGSRILKKKENETEVSKLCSATLKRVSKRTLKGAQSHNFELFQRRTKVPLNRGKLENSSFTRSKNG